MPLSTIFGLHLFWLSAFNLGSPERQKSTPCQKFAVHLSRCS
jgi:hypothetical protein